MNAIHIIQDMHIEHCCTALFCTIACIISCTVYIVHSQHQCDECIANCAQPWGRFCIFLIFPTSNLPHWANQRIALHTSHMDNKSKTEKASPKCEEKNWSVFMIWYFMVPRERKKMEKTFSPLDQCSQAGPLRWNRCSHLD